tara:strand:- start:75 stop:536 length:462 start_codon:yes stop_codon:yes gene_type:complete
MNNFEEKLMNTINRMLEEDDTFVLNVNVNNSSKNAKIQIMIDNRNGVSLDECVRVSRLTENIVKLNDDINKEFSLEVTSPGINRPLFTLQDYKDNIGSSVKISLKKMQNNTRNILGKLENVTDLSIIVRSKNSKHQIQLDNIKKANLHKEIKV